MADKRADLAVKKAAELDRELDEYIESLKKKADGKLRKPEVTEENWQEVQKRQHMINHVAMLSM